MPSSNQTFRLEAIQHVFWDWNGTLLDDAWLCRDVMNGMLSKRGMPRMSAERYRELFDFPVRDYYMRVGFDFSLETFEDLGMEFIQGYEKRRREAQLYSDARSALELLASKGVPQSILSAYQQETLTSLVTEHGLRRFFEHLHGHKDHYAAGKIPQARHAMNLLGLAPSSTLLIGDTAHDACVAAELGMACWLIPGGNQQTSRLKSTGCPLFSSRADAVHHLLTSLAKS